MLNVSANNAKHANKALKKAFLALFTDMNYSSKAGADGGISLAVSVDVS